MSDLFWRILIFNFLISFVVAKLEIEIEGKYGWARNLPTKPIQNKLIQLMFISGSEPFTNYHYWLFMTALIFMHLPFFVFPSFWSVSSELFVLGNFMLAIFLEDLFWFSFNPNFGIKKLNRQFAPWHEHWLGPIPTIYIRSIVLAVIFLWLSWIIQA